MSDSTLLLLPLGTSLLPDEASIALRAAQLHNGHCSTGGCDWCIRKGRFVRGLRALCDDWDREYDVPQHATPEEPSSLIGSTFTKMYRAVYTRLFS